MVSLDASARSGLVAQIAWQNTATGSWSVLLERGSIRPAVRWTCRELVQRWGAAGRRCATDAKMSQGAVDYSYKWINDNIHGHIRLDKACCAGRQLGQASPATDQMLRRCLASYHP